jgi:hypothetical protein
MRGRPFYKFIPSSQKNSCGLTGVEFQQSTQSFTSIIGSPFLGVVNLTKIARGTDKLSGNNSLIFHGSGYWLHASTKPNLAQVDNTQETYPTGESWFWEFSLFIK